MDDPVRDERVEIVRNEIRREMVRLEIELLHRRIPNPERRPALPHGCYQLPAQPRPADAGWYVFPAPGPLRDNRVQLLERRPGAPDDDGGAGRAARVLAKHLPRLAVIREKLPGIRALSGFFQQWPILQQFPRTPVAAPPPRFPLRAVVGHARGRPLQHICNALLSPSLPVLRRPMVPLPRFLRQGSGTLAIARSPELPAA